MIPVGNSVRSRTISCVTLVLYPRANIAVVIPLLILLDAFYIPAVLLIGMWFLMQLFSGVASIGYATGGSGGVAWWAHIGGFLVGMLLVGLFRLRRPPIDDLFTTRCIMADKVRRWF